MKLFTAVIFKAVLPLSGVERNCSLQAFYQIPPPSHLFHSTLRCSKMKLLHGPFKISKTKCWCYLNRSAILRPNHIPPFHQWSLQGVQSRLPETDIAPHIHCDHTSSTERSHQHIRLWNLGQPAGVRRHRHWPADQKYVGKRRHDELEKSSIVKEGSHARVFPGSTFWPWLIVSVWCLPWEVAHFGFLRQFLFFSIKADINTVYSIVIHNKFNDTENHSLK